MTRRRIYHEGKDNRQTTLGGGSALWLLFISGAGKHRQLRVFGKSLIFARQLAEQKDRSAVRFHNVAVDAIRAKPHPLLRQPRMRGIGHGASITHAPRVRHPGMFRCGKLQLRLPRRVPAVREDSPHPTVIAKLFRDCRKRPYVCTLCTCPYV